MVMPVGPGRELRGFGLKGTGGKHAPLSEQRLQRGLETLIVNVVLSPGVSGVPLRDLRNERLSKIIPTVEPGIT